MYACLAVAVLIAASAKCTGRSGGQAAAADGKPQSAATPQTPTQPLPPFRAGANLVRVDVFPTKDGKPVRDLTAADFDVFEDGKPQKVESFEHIEISGQAPQEERREPNTVREARAMAEDPRSRIFIIFLDTYHTEVAGSHRMQTVLEHLLDRIIGPDDLFGVMTPEMSADGYHAVAPHRSDGGLPPQYWYWGRRDRARGSATPSKRCTSSCYPENYQPTFVDPRDPTGNRVITEKNPYHNVAQEMIKRRREKRVLDALEGPQHYLQGLREERKAVIAVSDGWLLFRENQALMRMAPATCRRPGRRSVAGQTAASRATEPHAEGNYSQQTCDADKMQLAQLDNWQTFRDLLDRANRANVSFYPIDSRGLPAFDTQINEDTADDYSAFRSTSTRRCSRRASRTSGRWLTRPTALPSSKTTISNAACGGSWTISRRIYLLGYYSTNPKLDGRFRSIKVKREAPGRGRSRTAGLQSTDRRRGHTRPRADGEVRGLRSAPGIPDRNCLAAAVRSNFRFITSVSWLAAPIDDSRARREEPRLDRGRDGSGHVERARNGWGAGRRTCC